MYAAGARIFIECGPKRVLSGLISTILRRDSHRTFSTNHPKRGEIQSFRETIAGLTALNRFPAQQVVAASSTITQEETSPQIPKTVSTQNLEAQLDTVLGNFEQKIQTS